MSQNEIGLITRCIITRDSNVPLRLSQISNDVQQQELSRGRDHLARKRHNNGILKVQAREIPRIATGCHHLSFDCVH